MDSTPVKSANSESESQDGEKSITSRALFSVGDKEEKEFEPLMHYEWPEKSGEKFFIQDQISDFLGVKTQSFRRKYSFLVQREIEHDEMEYLISSKKVKEALFANVEGLKALRSLEVCDIISNDFPQKFDEFQKILKNQEKEEMQLKQRELDSIKSDAKKLADLRRKCVQSASEWNHDMIKIRRTDRRYFWELQTNILHEDLGKRPKAPGDDEKNPGLYPVACVQGQFQNFYKRYSPANLRRIPMNSAFEWESFAPKILDHEPAPISVDYSEIEEAHRQEERAKRDQLAGESQEGIFSGSCYHCRQKVDPGEASVRCVKCKMVAHGQCLDMSQQMYAAVKKYPWMCMECKPCSVCATLDQEEMMLFCDHCDRGYHTFCVGLDALPTGCWICPKYCAGISFAPTPLPGPRYNNTTTEGAKSYPKCKECSRRITKANKVHHRSKLKDEGLCTDCVTRHPDYKKREQKSPSSSPNPFEFL